MGTLTADLPRLAEHCPHKLATSCRLTSTPNCCACADERPHSTSYSVYIDGVGFVQRGTRWQSYCWFCKEFWDHRISATDPPLAPSRTRIPQIPDQSEFIDRWNEFHQGYRIVHAADGTESRIAVIGEPLRDVDPGFLPRTLNELRTGQQNDASRASNRIRRTPTITETLSTSEPHRTIEEELDNLLRDNADDGEANTPTNPMELSDEIRRQMRERRAERRTADHMRRVWGTREDIQSDEYMSPITNMFRRTTEWARQRERRRNTARQAAPTAEGARSGEASPSSEIMAVVPPQQQDWTGRPDYETVLSEIEDATHTINQYLERLATQIRARSEQERSMEIRQMELEQCRIWEDDIQNTANRTLQHEPPIEGLDRTRRRALADARQNLHNARNSFTYEIRTHMLNLQRVATPQTPSTGRRDVTRDMVLEGADRDLMENYNRLLLEQNHMNTPRAEDEHSSAIWRQEGLSEGAQRLLDQFQNQGNSERVERSQASLTASVEHILEETRLMTQLLRTRTGGAHLQQLEQPHVPSAHLDNDGRPKPKSEAEKMVKLECAICYQQIASIACVPCGHLVMCEWCADIHMPVKHQNVPATPSKCPMCRKKVNYRVKIHYG